jgi:periplasmic copper chaperone A
LRQEVAPAYGPRMFRRATIALLLALAGCSGGNGPTTVEDARVTLPAVSARPGAAYFTLTGSNEPNEALVGIESSRAERIELHRTVTSGSATSMEPVAEVPIGPEERRFEPGGDHAMVFGIDPSIQAGGEMPLVFRFRSGRTVQVQADVLAPGDVHSGH